jgi:hypothetical protein
MKRIIPLIVVNKIGGLFYLQKQYEKSATEAAAKGNPPCQGYEHDRAKQALDKTSKGVRDVRDQTKTLNRPERGRSHSAL